jgi:cation transport regulator ChaC
MSQVFISYSRKDHDLAKSICIELGTAGLDIWIDIEKIPVAYAFEKAIDDGIRTSDLLLVIVTKQALASRWVRKEIQLARGYQLANLGVKVLPVLVGVKSGQLPQHLQHLHCISMGSSIKPVDVAREVACQVLRALRDQPVRLFRAPPSGYYNREYYDYLVDALKKATASIWITGRGFNCAPSNPEGRAYADQFLKALDDALGRGVQLRRVQTGPDIDPYWAERITGLLRKYPSRMRLWRFEEALEQQLVSLTAIDPDNRESCLVEIMLSGRRAGDPTGEYAAMAVAVRRDVLMAQVIQKRIDDLTRARGVYEVSATDDGVDKLINRVGYFAYGTNIDQQQMAERSRNLATFVGLARLANHRIVFDQYSHRYTDGGVATIESGPGETIGVVWSVPWSLIRELDRIERPDLYERNLVEVVTFDGEIRKCYAYVGIKRDAQVTASKTYVAALIRAAHNANLPDTYIDDLKRKGDVGPNQQSNTITTSMHRRKERARSVS